MRNFQNFTQNIIEIGFFSAKRYEKFYTLSIIIIF